MTDIDSNAYKVLKKLSKAENSRYFTASETFWLGYLHKHGLVQHTFIKTSPNNSLAVYVINLAGKSFITEHRKNVFTSWLKWLIPIAISISALIIALLK